MLYPTLAMVPQAATEAGALATWANLAIIVIALALVAIAFMAGSVMLRFNRILSELQRSAHQNFGPVSDRARSISDNVEFITQALRTDVEKLNASLRALSDRLHQASDRMEERIEEFNALMEVVQVEAEEIFIDTASTVRGVREGARAITHGSAPHRRSVESPSSGDGGGPRRGSVHPAGPETGHPTGAVGLGATSKATDPGPEPGPPSDPEGSSSPEADPQAERAAPAADPEKAVRAGED